MDDTRWDHGLTVTGEGPGLVGHAGAVLCGRLPHQAATSDDITALHWAEPPTSVC